MATLNESQRTTMQTIGAWSGIGLAGCYLVALSAVCIIAVVALLTAHQFQHAIRTAELAGKPVALWQVIELRENWGVLQRQALDATQALTKAQDILTAKELDFQTLDLDNNKAYAEVPTKQLHVIAKLIELGVPASKAQDARYGGIKSVPNFLELRKSLGTNGSPLDPLIEDVKKALLASAELDFTLGAAKRQLDDLRARILQLQQNATTSTAQFKKFLDDSPEPEKRALVGNFISQLNALGWPVGSFAVMEPDLLTLLLVLAMGTLGGTIHLARLYLDGTKDYSAGYFLYRPFLGAIVALVIFIVARTGVFVIAEPSQQNNGALLSPFFISFVAIISGLLAEQAIGSLQSTGTKWFQGALEESSSRYALRVNEEIKKQKRSREDLKKLLNLSEADYAGWLDGSRPSPLRIQEIVAAWLGKPIRELFTDIPPKST